MMEAKVEEDLLAEVQRLRAENAYQKNECLGCREGTARKKAEVIRELKHEHRLSLLLDVAGPPRSTYYYWIKKPKEPSQYTELEEEISCIVAENKRRDIAIGINTDGKKDVLGMWVGENESANIGRAYSTV